MGEEIKSGFLTRKDIGWCVVKGDRVFPVLHEDAMLCIDSDHGSVVEFSLVRDELGREFAKLGETLTEGMSWEDIEEWYSSDNYPPFGGPFTDALSPFEWLKLNFAPPKRRT